MFKCPGLSKHGTKLLYVLITCAKWNNSLSLPAIIAVTDDTTYSLLQLGKSFRIEQVKRSKVHPCTGTEALYRPYGP